MIIHFEGPDCVGKTTIAKELCERHGYIYHTVDNDSFFRDKKTDYFIQLLRHHYANLPKLAAQCRPGIVFDRNYISEAVYSCIFHRYTDGILIKRLDNVYRKLGAVVIFCYKNTYKEYDDKYVSQDAIKDVMYEYQNYFFKSKLPVLRLDTEDRDIEKQIRTIDDFLAENFTYVLDGEIYGRTKEETI
jgi:deoxyadenosine/deoxycytidine kinase